MNRVNVIIDGMPVAKARPRFSNGHTYTPSKTTNYEYKVAQLYEGPKIEGPVMLDIGFFFPIPKSWSKKKKENPPTFTKKPDIDNLLKAIMDGLNGVAWDDDSQVNRVSMFKGYTKYSEEGYTCVYVMWGEDDEK